MSKEEVLTAHETTIEGAAHVTAEQLRLATHIVRDHVHNLDETTHHALVARKHDRHCRGARHPRERTLSARALSVQSSRCSVDDSMKGSKVTRRRETTPRTRSSCERPAPTGSGIRRARTPSMAALVKQRRTHPGRAEQPRACLDRHHVGLSDDREGRPAGGHERLWAEGYKAVRGIVHGPHSPQSGAHLTSMW